MLIHINDKNFDQEVLNSTVPVLVDFWATWCGPCMMLGPELEKLDAAHSDTLKICKVNVDESPEICARLGIMSIPALYLYNGGKEVRNTVGYMPLADLEKFIA